MARNYLSSIILAAFIGIAWALPIYADGTVSGSVTSDVSGGPAIPGALVRTDGEPGYSAITATDGSYSITAPAGTYTILASAAGHFPQRFSAIIPSGSSLTSNIILRHLTSTGQISLPAPLDSGEPAGAPAAPGDNYPAEFTDMAAVPGPSAPQISGWNETVKPNESFTMTGARFSMRTGADLGTDTIVWIWARTSPSGGTLRQAKVWRVTENTLTALMPDDIPFGMYLVWVENESGASAPVCVNKPVAQWIGPLGNGVQAGSKKRVVGRNITYNHGTATSYVYMQPSSGGSFISCPTDSANPYMVQFTVPAGTPNGNYKVFVHNGQGGSCGWSDGLDMVVRDEWVRGTTETSLSPSGGDDTAAIQNAINGLSALPTGGTLRLSAGSFKTYDQIWINDKVRLVGAGMDLTTIQLRCSFSNRHDYVRVHGGHITIQDLTLNACLDSTNPPTYGIIEGPYPQYAASEAYDIKYLNIRVTGDYGTTLCQNNLGDARVEVYGCEFYRKIDAGGSDGWMHNSNLYGGPYGLYSPYTFETDDAFGPGIRTVFEYTHVETKDWPVNPANGSRNYQDWMLPTDYAYKVWAKRVIISGAYYGRTAYNYMAYITTKDVAVQDNMGEMFLFHGCPCTWFGNVISASGLTLNVRTDGLVDGQAVTIPNYGASLAGGLAVPDVAAGIYWLVTDVRCSVVVIAGKGIGQLRKIVSHTPDSVTVDKPWRIQPDSTSKIVLAQEAECNIIYNAYLDAFPPGYVQGLSAVRGIDIDGNGWNNACEGNTSHRTNGGRDILANSGGPSYWNVMRDETAVDCHNWGYNSYFWDGNPVGYLLLGNAYRNCTVNVYDSASTGGSTITGEGCVAENLNITAKEGYDLAGAVAAPWYNGTSYPDGFTLYRNGTITVAGNATSPPALEPVAIGATDGKQFLINNSYAGSSQTYYLSGALQPYSIPAVLYRVAKLTGYVGLPVQKVMVPVANAGIASMTWTATASDPWIVTTLQSNATLSAESTMGRLLVGVDTSGLTAGRHWGSVTVNSGPQSIKVGVCLDLLSGSPSQNPPVASFSASPSGGPAPLATVLNAAGSYDPDGSIASYYWDFSDGTYGTGVTVSHTYPTFGTYTVALTVTDNTGTTDTTWQNISVSPALTGVSISGSPSGAITAGTAVTLSASTAGGYLPQYRFLLKDANGWSPLTGYSTVNTCVWTPSVAGYYELKAQARNTGSTSAYDVSSGVLSYPVGLLPTGMKLWLKSDAGLSVSGSAVTAWTDQSGTGNNLAQMNGLYQPNLVDDALNGRPVVRFAGPNQILQCIGPVLSGSTSLTAFTQARLSQVSTPNYQYFWWNGPDSISGGYGCYMNTTNNMRSGWGSNSASPTYTTGAAVDNPYRIVSRFTSTSGNGPNELWVNGNSAGSRTKSGSNLSGGFFSVGNFGPSPGQGLYGDVAEILIYDRALTDSERGDVEQYLDTRWLPPTPKSVDRLKDVKSLGDGVLVSITNPKVALTASGVYTDGSVYVSEADRTCGIKILNAAAVAIGDNLTLTGTTDTDISTGERMLRVTSISTGANTPLAALGMLGKAFTASGQLVRVWGKVTAKTGSYLTVDDGSGSPVKIELDGLVTAFTVAPSVGQYISAAGPAGETFGAVPCVRPTADSDIKVY